MRRPRRREASWSVRLHEFLKATTPVLTSPKLSLGVAILNKPSTKWVKLSGDINWTPRWSLVKHIYCSGAKYRICPTSCCHRCKRCRTSHFARRNQLPLRREQRKHWVGQFLHHIVSHIMMKESYGNLVAHLERYVGRSPIDTSSFFLIPSMVSTRGKYLNCKLQVYV